MLQVAQKQLLECASAASKISSAPVRTVSSHGAYDVSIGTCALAYISLILLIMALTSSVNILLGNSNLHRPVRHSRKRKRSSIHSGRLFPCHVTTGHAPRLQDGPHRRFSSFAASVSQTQSNQRKQPPLQVIFSRHQVPNAPEPKYRGKPIDESIRRPHFRPISTQPPDPYLPQPLVTWPGYNSYHEASMLSSFETSRSPHRTNTHSTSLFSTSGGTVSIQRRDRSSTTLPLLSHRSKRLHSTRISMRSAPK
jgi:hypothetical protein